MQRKLVVLGALGLSLALLVVSACVGDAPDVTDGSGADGGNGSDGGGGGNGGDGAVGPTSEAGPDGNGPSPCAATPSGRYVSSGAFAFYGSNHGIAGTSNGWAYAGYHHQHGSISYAPDAAAIGDAGDPTEGATAARLDANGNVIWQQVFGGDGSDEFVGIAVDEQDNAYLVGWFDSHSITFGATTLTNPSWPSAQGMVVKLDGQTGAPQWAKMFVSGTFGFGCGSVDYANGRLVVSCSMGTSQSYTSTQGSTGVLTSGQVMASSVYGLDPATGNAIWADSFSTGAGSSTSVETDVSSVDVTDTTVVIAGTFGGAQHMADKTAVDLAPTGALQTGFVVELTADQGLYHFAKPFGGATDAGTIQVATAAGTSADGGIFVAGSFSGTVSFASPHTSVSGSTDAYVFYLDNKSAPPAWEKILGGSGIDGIRGVLVDGCGRPEVRLTAGSALGKIDGVNVPAPQNGAATIIAKLAAGQGTLLWASGTSNGGNADTNGIDPWGFGIDKNGSTRIVGDFRGQIDFGSGQVTVGTAGATPYFIEYAP